MESQLKIYNIDSEYIEFLQSYELSKRGFTKVSNNASSTYLNKKAYIGVVLQIEGMYYFAPLTHPMQHYEKSSSFFDRLSMRVYKNIGDGGIRELGRIMFCYMIPLAKNLIVWTLALFQICNIIL